MTQVYFMNPTLIEEDARRQLAAMFAEAENKTPARVANKQELQTNDEPHWYDVARQKEQAQWDEDDFSYGMDGNYID